MPFEVSDRADEVRKFTVSVDDMWPYLLRSHVMICSGLDDTHGPPPGAGEGLGLGEGAGAGGVLNACVALHALVVSPPVARERQNGVALLGSGVLRNLASPLPSLKGPCVPRRADARSLATWHSQTSHPPAPTICAPVALQTPRPGRSLAGERAGLARLSVRGV